MAEHSESRPRSGAALARTMSIHTVESGALRFAVVHASGERAPSAPASARLPDADVIMLMTSVQGEAALLVAESGGETVDGAGLAALPLRPVQSEGGAHSLLPAVESAGASSWLWMVLIGAAATASYSAARSKLRVRIR